MFERCAAAASPGERSLADLSRRRARWFIALLLGSASAALAEPAVPHDPTLPSVTPQALQALSDTQIRQQIMLRSQAPYAGRCVCPYETRDSKGRSCKGRHEVIRTKPVPLCYPSQVTRAMIDQWREKQASR